LVGPIDAMAGHPGQQAPAGPRGAGNGPGPCRPAASSPAPPPVDIRSAGSSCGQSHGGNAMKYLGLAYYSPEAFAAMAPEAVAALVGQCPELDRKMQATGRMRLSASLAEPPARKTLRPRGGRTSISDGPYAESKEVVGGLFVIEADSEEEALRIAAMHPAALLGEEAGWAVELVPLEFCQAS